MIIESRMLQITSKCGIGLVELAGQQMAKTDIAFYIVTKVSL